MSHRDEASGSGLVQRSYTVFVDTSLDTHLAILVSDVDNVSDLKKRLLLEHPLCFPHVGGIEISAIKVKRRGHFYHLSESMLVKKAFDGFSKSWFLFVEAMRVKGENGNRQLQQIDSSKHIKCLTSGVEPSSKRPSDIGRSVCSLEKDQHVKSKPSAYLSGADKQQPNDFEMDKQQPKDFEMETEKDATNTDDHQKVSAAVDHNSLDPEQLEKLKDHAMNAEPLDGDTRNEAKDVDENLTPERPLKTIVTEKRKRKPKRKTRSSDNHEPEEENHRPSHTSALASAVNAQENVSSDPEKASANVLGNGNIEFDRPENAAPNEIEPSGSGRENASTQDKLMEAVGDVTQNKDGADVQENDKSAKEPSTPRTPARKKRKTEKKPGKEDSVAGNVESMLDTNNAISMPEALSPQSSLVDRQKVSNLDTNKLASDHLEASSGLTNHLETSSGLTTISTADKKKKRKKSSKDRNLSVAATISSGDLVGGSGSLGVPVEGEPGAAVTAGNVDHIGVVSESCASLPREKYDDFLTVGLGKEIERGKKNVDDVGSGKAIHSAADNLQASDLASKGRKEAKVDEVAGHENEGEFLTKDDAEVMANKDDGRLNTDKARSAKSSKGKKKSKKAKNPDQGTLVTSSAQHVENPGTTVSSVEPIIPVDDEEAVERGEKNVDNVGSREATPSAVDNLQIADLASKGRKEANVDEVASLEKEGEFRMKDDVEAMANRDDGRINTDEAKSTKSSKGKKKSKKAKNPDQGTLVPSSAPHVEGTGITSAEPNKSADREDTIERGEKNVEETPSTADNLEIADLASKGRKEANVDEVAGLEKEGEFLMKDDAEAMANRDDGRINTDEAKSAKSSKSKKKSKKAKNPDQGTPVTSGAQHVEGPGTGVSSAEPVKPVDGEEPDSVIVSVLESLRQRKEEENLEKAEKLRKETRRRQPLDAVDTLELLVEENNDACRAPMVYNDNANETDDSSKPSKEAKKSAEVANSSQDTMLHKLNGNNVGKPSDQIEPSHEKDKMDVDDNFVSGQTERDAFDNGKTQDQGANGTRVEKGEAKSGKKKKVRDLHPGGSVDGSRSSPKPIEKEGSSQKAQPASSTTSQQSSKVKNDSSVSLSKKDFLDSFISLSKKDVQGNLATVTDGDVTGKLNKDLKAANLGMLKGSAARSHSKRANMADRRRSNADQIHASAKVGSNINNKGDVKSSGLRGIKNKPKDHKRKLLPVSGSIFKDDENWNSGDDESKASGSSTKRPSNASSDDSDEDSDATFKSPPNGSDVSRGKENSGRNERFPGRKDMSLERILRSSSRYKKAKLMASQSQPNDYDDDSLPFDCVPDSQAN